MTTSLRGLFERINRQAELILSGDDYVKGEGQLRNIDGISLEAARRIILICERGISLTSHLPNEPDLPEWENHARPMWMMHVSILSGERFNPHLHNMECASNGCAPALPIEIPRNGHPGKPIQKDRRQDTLDIEVSNR